MNAPLPVKLREVAEINPAIGARPAPGEEIDFVPMASVDEELVEVRPSETRVSDEVSTGYTNFQDGDVLVAKITPCFENGKIAIARLGRRHGFGSTEFHVVRAAPAQLDSRYLVHFLRQERLRREGELKMTGSAGQRRVPRHFLENLDIPLPSIAEQRRIAAILDAADALRQRRRHTLSLLNELSKSLFVDRFSDGLADVDPVPLGELVEEFRYGTSNKSGDRGYPTLRIPNVIGDGLDLAEIKLVDVDDSEFDRLRLRNGDVLFVRTNGNPDYVGRCGVFSTDQVLSFDHDIRSWIYASYLIRARVRQDRLHPVFLREYLLTQQGRKALRERSKTSAGQYNINTEGLGSIPIPLPSLANQIGFVDILKGIEGSRNQAMKADAFFASLFTSLQRRAFRGEL